jgi:hypothetical protein
MKQARENQASRTKKATPHILHEVASLSLAQNARSLPKVHPELSSGKRMSSCGTAMTLSLPEWLTKDVSKSFSPRIRFMSYGVFNW